MNNEANAKLSTIRTAVEHAREDSQVAGLAVTVAFGTGPVHTVVVGADEKENALVEDSLFPISSITKLSVALALLRLSDMGMLVVEDPLSRFVPDAASAQSGINLKQLLTHTTGLPTFTADAWTWDEGLTWRKQAQACLTIFPTTPPGARVAYTNVNYGLLGIVIERVSGRGVHDAVNELVIRPLGIDAYLGTEPPRLPIYITDSSDKYVGTPLEQRNSQFWRSLGAPFNGMVATPAATLALIRAYRGHPVGFLRPDTIVDATQDQTGGLGGGLVGLQEYPWCPWGLGPLIIVESMNHFTFANANLGTLGHAGDSGCVVLADPVADVAWSIHGTQALGNGWFTKGFTPIGNAVLTSAAK